MTLYLAHTPIFDKRASPVLSRNEITKHATPKQGGGCEANAHLGKHDKSVAMGRLASMPGGPEGVGPIASMPGGPEEIAMLAGDNGHSAADLAFRLGLLLHTKASSCDARAQSASPAVCTLRLRSVNRCMANRNCNKKLLIVCGDPG